MEAAKISIKKYREQQRIHQSIDEYEENEAGKSARKDRHPQPEATEEECKFNSVLSTLLAENSWKLVSTRTGRYKVQFKSSLDNKDRINILEIVLEDIRERYLDLKAESQRLKRKYQRGRTRRKYGS